MKELVLSDGLLGSKCCKQAFTLIDLPRHQSPLGTGSRWDDECNDDFSPAISVGQAKLNLKKGLHMTGKLALLLGTSLVASLFFWPQRCAAAAG